MQGHDSPVCHGTDRRTFVRLGIGAFAVAALPLSLRRRATLVRRNVPVMGTLAEIAVAHGDERYAHRAIDAAVRELRWVDRTMTRFNDASDVGRANLVAHEHPVAITEATATVLREGLRWADRSDGVFDPCLGSAVRLWDVKTRREPPSDRDIRLLAGRGLYRALELDSWRDDPVVRFTDADVSIDLGGIAKGYGVDRAVRALREWGIEHALVNVGGDLYAVGRSPDGDPWRIGVRSAEDPALIAANLEVEDQAVATSGDYLQFFKHNGRRYHHLLDPSTGAPKDTAAHSVTVVAVTCMTADVAATTAFGVGTSDAGRILGALAPDARIV